MTTGGRHVPTEDITRTDLNDPGVVADPFPVFEAIREQGPIVYSEAMGSWLVTSRGIYRRIVSDTDLFSSAGTIEAENFGAEAYIAIDDRDRHDAMRGVWAARFHRNAVARDLQPLIAAVADDLLAPLLERLREGETVDVGTDFCRDLPTYVICAMLGIPQEDRARFAHWSDLMGSIPFVPEEELATHPAFLAAQEGGREMGEYLRGELVRRRTEPGDDLISMLVHSEVARTMSEESQMQNVRQLLFAGNETTANWLKNLLVTLHRYPDVRRAVTEDRDLLPRAMEEEMRWEGLVNLTPRRVTADVEVEGRQLREDDSIWLLNTAVSRDPEWHERPGEYDPHRENLAHVGFGFGMHHCLGINLARLEARTTISRLLEEVPEWEIEGTPDYGNYFPLRAPAEVRISLA